MIFWCWEQDYMALRSTWMREKDGFILVFDVTQRSTFEDIRSFYDQLIVMHEERVPPVLLGACLCYLAIVARAYS